MIARDIGSLCDTVLRRVCADRNFINLSFFLDNSLIDFNGKKYVIRFNPIMFINKIKKQFCQIKFVLKTVKLGLAG